jgi:hypothetical protein
LQLPQLEHLTATNNQITTLEESDHAHCCPCTQKEVKNHPLQHLDVSNNKIQKFCLGQLNDMPNLATLDLSNNPLEKISIHILTSRWQPVAMRLYDTKLAAQNRDDLRNGACIRRDFTLRGIGMGATCGAGTLIFSPEILFILMNHTSLEGTALFAIPAFSPPAVALVGACIGGLISRCIPITQAMIDKLYTLDFGIPELKEVSPEQDALLS